MIIKKIILLRHYQQILIFQCILCECLLHYYKYLIDLQASIRNLIFPFAHISAPNCVFLLRLSCFSLRFLTISDYMSRKRPILLMDQLTPVKKLYFQECLCDSRVEVKLQKDPSAFEEALRRLPVV